MKAIKFLLIGGAVAMTMASCCNANKNSEENTATAVEAAEMVTPMAVNVNDYYGTFEGILPCADCEGIKTVVTLRDDSTYDSTEEYLGKDGITTKASGTYSVLDGDVVELVTPSTNAKTYYKKQDGNLVRVGEDLKVNEGELAEMYILKKVGEEAK